MSDPTAWSISGTCLESCNCDAICPCRRVGGKAGGRSTHGICLGTLPWAVTEGWAGDVEYVENGATSGSGRRAPTS